MAAKNSPNDSKTGKINLINRIVWVCKSRKFGATDQYAKIPKKNKTGSERHPNAAATGLKTNKKGRLRRKYLTHRPGGGGQANTRKKRSGRLWGRRS